jgi:hypothetical protein
MPARSGPNNAAVLDRVRRILAETCERDSQGANLQETQRRKAYRAGINQALAEIDAARATPPPGKSPAGVTD